MNELVLEAMIIKSRVPAKPIVLNVPAWGESRRREFKEKPEISPLGLACKKVSSLMEKKDNAFKEFGSKLMDFFRRVFNKVTKTEMKRLELKIKQAEDLHNQQIPPLLMRVRSPAARIELRERLKCSLRALDLIKNFMQKPTKADYVAHLNAASGQIRIGKALIDELKSAV
jgi:hypothetical protein